jgi:porphobilinogen synthase
MIFPEYRARRLRKTEGLRSLLQETRLSVKDFVYPLFVFPGKGKQEISSMPGIYRLGLEDLAGEIKEIDQRGIPAVILFGLPRVKDAVGSEAFKEKGIIQQAIQAIKAQKSRLTVICDLCLCEYTDHGHCGKMENGELDNDATLEILGEVAVAQARAGADMVAPSGMIDGQVQSIREALDEHGFEGIPIMAYSAKYASAFYGPFRDAAQSAPQFGDRKSYQMDPPNVREALREIQLDIDEGADIVMIKPALAYLDVIARARMEFNHPIAAYNVSGEYSMIEAAARAGFIERERAIMEVLTAIKRAGADIIISYYAKEMAQVLEK